jgi:hypothetical protein
MAEVGRLPHPEDRESLLAAIPPAYPRVVARHVAREHSKSWGAAPCSDRVLARGGAGPVPKLVWRVKLVAELQPGVTTETELARLERDGSVSARAKPDDARCRPSSAYAASRMASALVARRR